MIEVVLNVWRTAVLCMGISLVGLQLRLWLVRHRQEATGRAPTFTLPAWASIGWILVTLMACIEIVGRYNDPMTFRTPMATVAFVVALAGMFRVLETKR